ncbi:hypothetical protein HYQ44_003653 [Verticillium longisporum]|nr:hypothetical protein HYQ44_003653 [Verticillium longisporum]
MPSFLEKKRHPAQNKSPSYGLESRGNDKAASSSVYPGTKSNSSLNPDSAPWTPALVPEGMPPVSQQAPHGFHNSYNLHHSQPLNTTEYVGNMQSRIPFGQQFGQEASIVHNEHQQDAEKVEPLYRTLYDPSGMVIPQENLLDTAGTSSTISGIHVPGHIAGLGGPSGFPPPIPPIRPFEPAHGVINSQPGFASPNVFNFGGTDSRDETTVVYVFGLPCWFGFHLLL